MNTWTDTLFYLVFLSQILLVSYLVPRLILSRAGKVLKICTPETHPAMYPEPLTPYRNSLSTYKWVNHAIMLLGLVLLVIVYRLQGNDGHANINDAWPVAYGVLQFLPWAVMSIVSKRVNQRMRKIAPIKQRKAELRPRRLFNFASPGLFILAVAMMIAALLLNIAVSVPADTLVFSLAILGGNVLVALIVWKHLRGSNLTSSDPDRRKRKISMRLTMSLLASMAMNIYLMIQIVSAAYGLHGLDPVVISLYLQSIMAISIVISVRAAPHTCRSCA